MIQRLSFIAVCVLAFGASLTSATLEVTELRVEGLSAPSLIATDTPRFSWQLKSEARGARQTAYQLKIESLPAHKTEEVVEFKSPKIKSSTSHWVTVPDLVLSAKSSYRWQVRVWDGDDNPAPWSTPAQFSTSLFKTDWQAAWISDGIEIAMDENPPARLFRKTFSLPETPSKATLYLSAFGLVEPWINGESVTDDKFIPGWPDYRKRNYYVAYDVSNQLRKGANALGLQLGDGWYSGTVLVKNQYGPTPMVSAWIEITLPDGSSKTIATDASWRWQHGPVTAQGIYYGEDFDARKVVANWSRPQATENPWQPVVVEADPSVPIEPRLAPAVRAIEELEPVSRRQVGPESYIFDLGQNMVGWVRLKVQAEAGQEIHLRFAEMLEADGSLHTANLRSARASAHYTASGEGVEEWEPTFSFFGFRYVQLSGLADPLEDAVTGVVVHSDLKRIGTFESSNPLLNQLYSNTLWGQKGNFLEIPTDCPQRNERLGWTGDAQVFCHTAHYNLESGAFFRQWLAAVRDSFEEGENGGFGGVAPHTGLPRGAAGWSDAGVIVPWVTWLHTGDQKVLTENFPYVQRWIALQEGQAPEGIRISRRGWGDWLAPGYKPREAPTPYVLIATAYFAHTTRIAAKMAEVLDKPDLVEEYNTLFERIKSAFQKEYISPDGKITSDEQTAYLMALGFDLVSQEVRPKMIHQLQAAIAKKDNHLATGFLGTPLLAPVLTETDLTDLAYEIVLKETYPGWLFSVKNGATTVWERWDSWTPEEGFNPAGMNSFNHYAYGSVVGWFYDTIAGLRLDPDAPGWKHFFVEPRPGGNLTFARASLETPYGPARSDWEIEGGRLSLNVQIPPNSTSTVILPTRSLEDLTEGGKGLDGRSVFSHLRMENGQPAILLPAGHYTFSMPYPN